VEQEGRKTPPRHPKEHLMKAQAEATPPLLPEWMFVVQFREGTAIAQNHVTGRVEHVMSGQATRFQSMEDLWAFIAQILSTVSGPLSGVS
jgi:hypothetical protein